MGVPGAYIGQRGGPAAEWTTDNPVLREREAGWETDTGRVKLGDGVTAWVDLPYAADEGGQVATETARAEAAEAALDGRIDTLDAFLNEDTIDAQISAEVVSATSGHIPGSEMGYAETTGNITTTNVFPTPAIISALTIVVSGEGRPVDIELFIPRLTHSVAGSEIYGIIASQIVGSGVTVYEQIIGASSPFTTRSDPFYIKRRKVLTDGVDYTMGFYVCSVSVAGTVFAGAAGGLQRMWSGVTSR